MTVLSGWYWPGTNGTPNRVSYVYNGPPGQGVGFGPGFDLDNYTFTTASFPVANVFVDPGLTETRVAVIAGTIAVGWVTKVLVEDPVRRFHWMQNRAYLRGRPFSLDVVRRDLVRRRSLPILSYINPQDPEPEPPPQTEAGAEAPAASDADRPSVPDAAVEAASPPGGNGALAARSTAEPADTLDVAGESALPS